MIELSAEILSRASRGDLEAFKEVYAAGSGFVYNVALRITRNASDAEEVTQDVFLKVYRHLKDFAFRSKFSTWLYRITVNTAINRYRQLSRQGQRTVSYDDALQPDEQRQEPRVVADDSAARIDLLLAGINQEQQVCLILREIEGFSYSEIAKVLRIPVNTVRSRLKRGRLALAQKLRKGPLKNEL